MINGISLNDILTFSENYESDEESDPGQTVENVKTIAERYIHSSIGALRARLQAAADAMDEVIEQDLNVDPFTALEAKIIELETTRSELLQVKNIQREEIRRGLADLAARLKIKKNLIEAVRKTAEEARKTPIASKAIGSIETGSRHISGYFAQATHRYRTESHMSYAERPADRGYRSKEMMASELAKLKQELNIKENA